MENQNQEQSSVSSLLSSFKELIREIFDISKDTDRRATIEDIRAGIDMRGQNAWVLIFSILIASTGLNTSSTAVVIGAMLISPLMGPILGMGLALGINDIELLRKSLKNFGVMVVLSLSTSFLFFSVPLFQNETPELIARTSPNVLDIIIALSGGLALLVALSRRNKSTNTIAGVAIATALMPPLCTAGFGLATGKWDFFGGALFLFSINTIFIATATYLVVKSLRFPLKEYADKQRKKQISQLLTVIALAIFVPSVYFFYKLYKKSDFERKVETVLLAMKDDKGIGVFDIQTSYKDNTVSFAVIGESLENTEIKKIQDKITSLGYPGVQVKVLQDLESKKTLSRLNEIENSYLTTQQLLMKKEEQLLEKDKEIFSLKSRLNNGSTISFVDVAEELKSLNENIQEVSYYNILHTNFKAVDTVPNFIVKWDKEIQSSVKEKETDRFTKWLQTKLKSKKVVVRSE
ncbi:DUF389 domain-containing protein [Flavobacterium sp. NRK F10]|uniref:DUF389 domain-containing protein n=1 Tax=Flavobacterium sp. NRK F10 TaxID=2954931 RepID=UPI002091C36F|nr:DUF389 domain-containing protein [Flavobacterium sp. NRK F10]MCO6174332.1 DUF389 domain-containing protein [Flavobacterium sp. NRK F10]